MYRLTEIIATAGWYRVCQIAGILSARQRLGFSQAYAAVVALRDTDIDDFQVASPIPEFVVAGR
jgi:hypothetical protein